MRTLTLLALTLTALVVPVTAAGAAAPTCLGKEVTIVGTAEEPLYGTPRADVVVTNGADDVVTGDGDDLVCITGRAELVTVNAGDGDDRVVVLGSGPDHVNVHVGRGSDTYRGGAGKDVVAAKDGGDSIDTKGGRDRVRVASTRARPSSVRTGGSQDSVQVIGGLRGLRVAGGPEADRIEISGTFKGTVRVDNSAGSLVVGGSTLARWADLEQFDLDALAARRIVFIGTDADERVTSVSREPRPTDFQLTTGAGADEVMVDGQTHGTFDAGPGRDVFEVSATWNRRIRSLSANLMTGELASSYRDDTHAWSLSDVSDLLVSSIFLSYADVSLTGDEGPNRLVADGCRVAVHAQGGDDVIEGRTYCSDSHGDGEEASELYGDEGDDLLVGSIYDDLLDGGPGTDVAHGRDGTDTCHAETVTECELP
jgi:Ca2+-binding RTX toxin-like protein